MRGCGLGRVRQHLTMDCIAEQLVELWFEVLYHDERKEHPNGY